MQSIVPYAMNIHHLELFYYVAQHGGVSAAARKIPYGIQQPAISAQVLRLEEELGQTLFHRRPFRLTPAGQDLFTFIEPFFSGIATVGRRLRGGDEIHLSIGAQELILRDYLPSILRSLREQLPKFTFTLHNLSTEDIEQRLLSQQLDIGLVPLIGKRSEGLRQRVIIELPPVLLVPENSEIQNAASLWKRQRIDEPLVSLPPGAPLAKDFQRELTRRGIEWPISLELPSLDLVARYVAEGHGIGLSAMLPRTPPPKGTRLVSMPGFPSVPVGVVWLGTPSIGQKHFIEEAAAFAARMKAELAGKRK